MICGGSAPGNILIIQCLNLKAHIYNQSWILHLTNASPKYSAARLIKSNNLGEIICNIFRMWITYFGAFKHLDKNKQEFNNEV